MFYCSLSRNITLLIIPIFCTAPVPIYLQLHTTAYYACTYISLLHKMHTINFNTKIYITYLCFNAHFLEIVLTDYTDILHCSSSYWGGGGWGGRVSFLKY